MRQAREAEEARAHQEAAAKAAEILRSGRKDDISGHPYAAKKAIDFGPLVRRGAWPQRGWIDALLVPIYNADGQVISLEAINTSGDKDFLRGGAKRGGIHPIGNIKTARRVLIAEGIANAAVAIAALGDPAVAAMDAGNLKAAGETVRQINPGAELVFLADNDVREDGRNPGAEAATSAALALGGKVAIPELDGRKCDFWDLLHERGAEAVRRAVEAASAPPSSKGSPEGECALDVNLIRGCDIRPEPIEWIWGGWLAAGKMHILGGAPGGGKTTIALAFAATVTGNGRWPDGTRSSVGNVVIWSGEDDPADTLIPRLSLSGADLSRVYFIADIREGSERRSFDPARDMEPLRRKLAEIGGVKLLIVDPIVSAIAGDSHKNAEVRRGLQPLADLAASMRCALIGITHFSKGTGGRDPVERLTGSLAFGALARVVLVAAKHQEEGDDGRAVRLLLRAKSNIGPDDGGFEYDLRQAELKTYPGIFASSVLWGTAVEGAARELLAAADATAADGDGGTLVDAKRFLADLLADGPMPAKAIRADADGAGYSWTTIRRAQKALGIEPAKTGGRFGGGKQQWMWRLPEDAQPEHLQDDPQKMSKNAEDAQQNNVGTFCESDHLQGDSGFVEVEV
jgi:putative DNA primase/helicase